ncbi:flagellar export protein FliJ [Variovorax sp. PBL-E5]|uniref:flagellar export protein FliJ n=1 Tax=Variovorax sp. PBL-E5 TaxID=434014 RepID=UPI0013160A6D|nr:flagellar export protein FliJ [Variovorax sp. PBL-E5]VTU33371.1 Flagellar FliJ protein [Variovorax sp. PBL-E5]
MPQRLPLDTLTDLERTQTDDAARRLGTLQTARITADQKLALLQQYRRDYYDQLQALMMQGLPTAKWRNYQNFLATLDGAIDQQRAIAAQAASRVDHGRVDWQDHKRRLNSFDTLAERVRRQELLAQAKNEQRESDERSARKFFDRPTHPIP